MSDCRFVCYNSAQPHVSHFNGGYALINSPWGNPVASAVNLDTAGARVSLGALQHGNENRTVSQVLEAFGTGGQDNSARVEIQRELGSNSVVVGNYQRHIAERAGVACWEDITPERRANLVADYIVWGTE